MKVYLDNCCFNRPYDDQTQLTIRLETQAKLHIQSRIKSGEIDLVWSYILDYENSKNPFPEKRQAIGLWKGIAVQSITESEKTLAYAESLTAQGIKTFDALHIACAVSANCDYFLTTDRKLLRSSVPEITIMDPVEFIMEEGNSHV